MTRFVVDFESVISVAGTVTFTVREAVMPLFELAVIVAVPPPTAVIFPPVTVATDVSEEVQVIVLLVASAGETVAFTVVLWSMTRFAVDFESSTEVTSTTAGFTVTATVAVRPLLVAAVMVAFPAAIAVILPFDTVATDVSEDVQVTVLSVASEGSIVAVAVVLLPSRRFAVLLESTIEVTGMGAGVTVTATEAVLPLVELAVIVAVPAAFAVILPFETEATAVLEEDHVIVLSVAFEGATVAVTVADLPASSSSDVSESVTEVTSITGAFTVTATEAVLPLLERAVIVAVPAALAVMVPFETDATDVSEEDHVIVLSAASEGLTVAVTVAV